MFQAREDAAVHHPAEGVAALVGAHLLPALPVVRVGVLPAKGDRLLASPKVRLLDVLRDQPHWVTTSTVTTLLLRQLENGVPLLVEHFVGPAALALWLRLGL